jgi:hypothetical protein
VSTFNGQDHFTLKPKRPVALTIVMPPNNDDADAAAGGGGPINGLQDDNSHIVNNQYDRQIRLWGADAQVCTGISIRLVARHVKVTNDASLKSVVTRPR